MVIFPSQTVSLPEGSRFANPVIRASFVRNCGLAFFFLVGKTPGQRATFSTWGFPDVMGVSPSSLDALGKIMENPISKWMINFWLPP